MRDESRARGARAAKLASCKASDKSRQVFVCRSWVEYSEYVHPEKSVILLPMKSEHPIREDPTSSDQPVPQRRLRLLDCVGLTVGIIIGAGIYEFSPAVARLVGSPAAVPAVWFLGGFLVLTGAVCYAELVTSYPEAGGDYAFLTRGYGRRTGFLFAWCDFWIIRPGNVGAMAYLFARLTRQVVPIIGPEQDQVLYAVMAVGGLTLINLWGIRPGTRTQNGLTSFKLIGLLAVIVVGLLVPGQLLEAGPANVQSWGYEGFGLAIVLVVFTYGGWAELSYVAAEVRQPDRNIWRALAVGLITVSAIYVALNYVFIRALGYEGVCQSATVVTDLMRLKFPDGAGQAVSLLIAVSTLGAINGMILTGSRIYYALGRDHRSFAWLGAWSARRSCPVRSLMVQAAVTLTMVIWFGRATDALERLVVFTTPVYWTFFLLVTLAIVIFRWREPDRQRPHRTPFYPLPVILFAAVCLYVIYASSRYAWLNLEREVVWLLVVFGTGGLLTIKGSKE